jgi:4-amino-4-deoxy-L-arabinose transferase-like glycosyltransferase
MITLSRFWFHRGLLLVITLLGFALRLSNLGRQSLWYDETVSAFLAKQPPAELIAHTARDIHPPGYYLLLHYWALVAGASEFALAYFSLGCGLLLIPLIVLFTRQLINRHVALWAAALVALSPLNLWYSQEVRMYTLGAVLGVISAFSLYHALFSPAWPYWIGYVISAALGLYTLYYFALLLIVLNLLFLIYGWRQSSKLKPFIIANITLFILYLPWLPIAWRQAANPPVPPWRSPPQLWPIALESWTALSLGQSVEPARVWPILLLTLVLFVSGWSYMTQKFGWQRAWLLGLYTLGPWLLIYLFSLITPLYHVRYVFTYSPAFYVLLGAGLAWLALRLSPWAAIVAATMLLAASLSSIYQLHTDPRYRADDFRAAVAFIQQYWQPGDVILINAGYTYTAFDYYADAPYRRTRLVPYPPMNDSGQPLLLQTGVVDGSPQLGWNDPRSDFYVMSAAETTAALEQLAHDFSRLWLLRAYDTVTDPKALIRAWLADNATIIEDQPFAGESNIRVQGYLLNARTPSNSQPILFTDGMALAHWQLPQQTWQAGQPVYLKLWWTTTAKPQVDYKMSLKLWTPGGSLAAQGQDTWPVGSLYRATSWPTGEVVYQPAQITLPGDIPPGEYWLNVELYHPETIQPLRRQDNGEPFVTLGSLVITQN